MLFLANLRHEKRRFEMEDTKSSGLEMLTIGLLMASLFITAFNAYQLAQIGPIAVSGTGNIALSDGSGTAQQSQETLAGPDVIPKGVPNIYGKELGISFDDVSPSDPNKADATIRKLAVFDEQITLTGKDLERYIGIAGKISCEYCCGAPSIIFNDGKAACGCAHSYAMRGLAKYMIKNHGSEVTDDQILEEMGKWKTLFFPTVLTEKAKVLKDKGIELNYINLASNNYRGAEKGSSGGAMVGGC